LITLDNLSGLAPEISDALCRLCTGGGIDARQLYSDLEQVLVEIQRPILCNGIDDIATRPDLAERSILISLPVIDPAKRTPESVLSARLEREAGAIFGALLDGVAGALRALPDVRLDRLPRMADFALWGVAAESALGFKLGSFVKAYQANQDNAIEAGIEASPVGSALMLLMERSTTWTAAPTALLEQLTHIAGTQAKSKAWPQSPKGMANSFKRLAPSLRRVGIEIDQQQGNGRFYTITKGTRETHYPPNRMKPTPDGASSHADRHPDADHTGAYPPDDSLSACGKPSNDAASRRIGGSDGYAGACVSDDDNGPWSGIAAALREGT
jgi:hypothetical protein